MNLNGKRILVTGGAGFIGSHLASFLLKEKADVLLLDNFFTGKPELIPEGVEFKKADICLDDIKGIVNSFEPDTVMHLAAIHYIPYCNANPEEAFNVNVMGTRNVLEASKGIDFLFASSAAVYPILDDPLSEDLDGPMDIYGKTKLIGEDLTNLKSDSSIIARFFNVYGPDDTNPHVIPEIIDQIMQKSEIELGNLTPKRDYIYVDDLCEALIALLKHGKNEVYNIGTGTEHSVKKIVELLGEILDKEIKIVQDEKRIRKVEREHLLSDISKIKKDTGWKPQIGLKSGLERIIDSIN